MSKLPISLIVDDSGVVNCFHFHEPDVPHPIVIPAAFTRFFASVCHKHNIHGKFSVVPMPGCLGRLDESLNGVEKDEIEAVLDVVRNEIAPTFSITPEILTHHNAYNIKGGRYHYTHLCEDEYIRQCSPEEIADYIEVGLDILLNLKLNPTGVTCPWATGNRNEEDYAKGVGIAFKRRLNRERCFYFLHSYPNLKRPVIACQGPDIATVVSIPSTAYDMYWCTMRPTSYQEAAAQVKANIDAFLSPDGKTGLLRDRIAEGLPLIMSSHWQSLYSDGRGLGLAALDTLCERINRYLSDEVEWMNFDSIVNQL